MSHHRAVVIDRPLRRQFASGQPDAAYQHWEEQMTLDERQRAYFKYQFANGTAIYATAR